jgi:hypothetical protein
MKVKSKQKYPEAKKQIKIEKEINESTRKWRKNKKLTEEGKK